MDILDKNELQNFLDYVPAIRQNAADWSLVELSLNENAQQDIMFLAKKLQDFFTRRRGKIYVGNDEELIALANTGKALPPEKLANQISEILPRYSCTVETSGVTKNGLRKMEIKLQKMSEKQKAKKIKPPPLMSDIRSSRFGNILMVADDDLFMRSLVKKALMSYGPVFEAGDALEAIDIYKKQLPDILFLDIHMPGGSGIEVLREITKFDYRSHVIMLSADSVKDNIINAMNHGAKGFVAKPFTKDKLVVQVKKCPFIT